MQSHIIEEVRCIYCNHLLLKKITDLPFEVVSTGAIIFSIASEIKCDRCKTKSVYTMMPTFIIT